MHKILEKNYLGTTNDQIVRWFLGSIVFKETTHEIQGNIIHFLFKFFMKLFEFFQKLLIKAVFHKSELITQIKAYLPKIFSTSKNLTLH